MRRIAPRYVNGARRALGGRLPSIVMLLALVAAGCSSEPEKRGTGRRAPQTIVVEVGAQSAELPTSFPTYFPNSVRARPGDILLFTSRSTGEPHTVTMGTLVDVALAAAAKTQRTETATEPPEVQRLPRLIAQPSGEVDQAAAEPCFLGPGQIPGNALCAPGPQPPFTGREAFYNSGFLPNGNTFRVELARDMTPGAYGFLSLFHGSRMSGQITVADEGDVVPTAEDVRRVAEEQRTFFVGQLKGAAEAAVATARPDQALAGIALPEITDGVVDVFVPKSATVPAGSAMTWTVVGVHTITFNAPDDAGPVLHKGPGGDWQPNPTVVGPAGGDVELRVPPRGTAPEQDIAAPTVIDAGPWDGMGIRSSGLLVSSPAERVEYVITFTRPGTYSYRCLIHSDMAGSVRVT